MRYKKFKNCATDEQLEVLLLEDNNVIRASAWKAILIKNPKKAVQYMIENGEDLAKRNVYKFLNSCQGYTNQKLLRYLMQEADDRLHGEDIHLASEEIVEFLKFIQEINRSNRHSLSKSKNEDF